MTQMIHLAIVGSRNYPRMDQVQKFMKQLPIDLVIVSGGGGDVDKTAAFLARSRRMKVIEYLADWNPNGRFDKTAGMRRNTQIVDTCDMLVAFWDMESHGTLDSIRKATMQDKLWLIYTPFVTNRPIRHLKLDIYDAVKERLYAGEINVPDL